MSDDISEEKDMLDDWGPATVFFQIRKKQEKRKCVKLPATSTVIAEEIKSGFHKPREGLYSIPKSFRPCFSCNVNFPRFLFLLSLGNRFQSSVRLHSPFCKCETWEM